MPIRWRLTLWFSFIVLTILAATNGALYSQLDRYLTEQADRTLELHTSRVHGALLPLSIDAPIDYSVVHSQLPPIDEFSSPGVYIQLIDDTGAVVVKSANLINRVLPDAPSLTAHAAAGRLEIGTVLAADGTRVRILASPLYLHDQTFVLEVAQSLKVNDMTLSRLRLMLVSSILVAVVLVAGSGFYTLKRAFQPVQRIMRAAREIETGADLTRRVGKTNSSDEIGQLAATFDHMIQHLDSAFSSQKNFIADASHELRSPLTVIRGNLDLIGRNPGKENVAESLKAIEAEAARMSGIVNDLLLLAEVETGQEPMREMVRLGPIIKEELGRMRSLAASRRIESGQVEELSIAGDARRLRLLLGNLLENAIKYTPETAAITVTLRREGRWARLDVSDNGPGIAAEHLAHIFDRFYRVDKARSRSMGATGLGLAIVKGIAEQHGGNVDVSSEPGEGSSFTVRFPLNNASA